MKKIIIKKKGGGGGEGKGHNHPALG